jgi:hypothetical protein
MQVPSWGVCPRVVLSLRLRVGTVGAGTSLLPGGRGLVSDADSWQKEEFSRAYVLAVATQAGYTLGGWNVDKDGVDVTLRRKALMVDIQLKCTKSPRTTINGFSFDLDVRTYERLRDPERSAPAYLVLLIVPPVLDSWLLHEPERLIVASHAYWSRFRPDLGPASGQSVAISLARHNVLDAAAMADMFRVSGELVSR